MKVLLSIICLILPELTPYAQDLTIQAFTSPAHCRTAVYQNGNGEIYISANGGFPPYIYQIVDLQTHDTIFNTAGIGNPGYYKAIVTDNSNTSVSEIVYVDSINPVADFSLSSPDLILSNDKCIGFNNAEVTFTINAESVSTPWPQDTLYFWNLNLNQTPWSPVFDINAPVDRNYTPGFYDACLIKRNFNDCADTTCIKIEIYESLPDTAGFTYHLISGSENQTLTLNHNGFNKDLTLMVFNELGQLVLCDETKGAQTEWYFNQAHGIYFYCLFNSTNSIVGNGKFFY